MELFSKCLYPMCVEKHCLIPVTCVSVMKFVGYGYKKEHKEEEDTSDDSDVASNNSDID